MSCKRDFEEAIWEAAETGRVLPELERHLAECEECRRSLSSMQSAMAGFAALRDVEAADVRSAVHERLGRRAPRRLWGWTLAPAAALLVWLAVVTLWVKPDVRPVVVQVERPAVRQESPKPAPEVVVVERPVVVPPVPRTAAKPVVRRETRHAVRGVERRVEHPVEQPEPVEVVPDVPESVEPQTAVVATLPLELPTVVYVRPPAQDMSEIERPDPPVVVTEGPSQEILMGSGG